MLFNVLLCPELRVRVNNVEAKTQEEAVDRAIEYLMESGEFEHIRDRAAITQGDEESTHLKYSELSEDLEFALVDVVGDDEYRDSHWYKLASGGWVPRFEGDAQ